MFVNIFWKNSYFFKFYKNLKCSKIGIRKWRKRKKEEGRRKLYWENQWWGGHCRTFQKKDFGSTFLHKATGDWTLCQPGVPRYRSWNRRSWTPLDNRIQPNFQTGKSSNTSWASSMESGRRIWLKKSPWPILNWETSKNMIWWL